MFIKSKAQPTNVSKFFLPWIKLLVSVAAFAYIIVVILSLPKSQMMDWINSIRISNTGLVLFCITLVLALLNWTLEAAKWKILTSYIQNISMLISLKAVLFGVALGMITPKRLGEYAGRIVVLKKENRVKGLILNSLASLTQLLTTIAFGTTSLIIAAFLFFDDSALFKYNISLIISFSAISLLLILILIVFLKPIIRKVSKRIKSEKWKNYLFALSNVNAKTLLILLMLSIGRYAVFIFQFYLLINLLGLDISLFAIFILQSISYLIMTIIPVSALAETGVKSSVNLLVFGTFPALTGVNYEAALISASLLLWLINLALPALAGTILSTYDGIKLKTA